MNHFDSITPIKGAQRVRLRPAVIFGTDDEKGALTAVMMLTKALIGESQKGLCETFSFTHFLNDEIELENKNKGIFLGHPKEKNDSVWQNLFCEIFVSPLLPSEQNSLFEPGDFASGDTKETLALCAVQYASEFMRVSSVRQGFCFHLSFEKGESLGSLAITPCQKEDCTVIRFKPDKEVFSQITLSEKTIKDALFSLSKNLINTKIYYRRETEKGFEETLL